MNDNVGRYGCPNCHGEGLHDGRDAAIGGSVSDFDIGAVSLALIIPFIALLGMASSDDMREEQHQATEYCEMVELWKSSGGENGWPAYKGEKVCE